TNVIDPWGGSYFMENLTQQLADKAWSLIEEIEEQGGMAKAIETGMPKLRIEESAARKQARIDRGDDVIVGVNKYKLAKEDPVDILDIDNHAVRESQIQRLQKIRDTRRESEVEAILEAIFQAAKAGAGKGNLLDLAIKATRARATVGEISYAMERAWAGNTPQPKPGPGANASRFNRMETGMT